MAITPIPLGLQLVPQYPAAPALNAMSKAHGPASSTPSPRLVSSAHEFEAQMMKELLAPLSSTGTEDEENGHTSGSALKDYATEALGRALSNSGGFGVAKMILHSVAHSGTKGANSSVIGNLPVDTQISHPE